MFIMRAELKRLGRRGGLPTHGPHDEDVAAAGKCSCGCRPNLLQLRRPVVNLALMIDMEAPHTQLVHGCKLRMLARLVQLALDGGILYLIVPA
jgi:hypothetical protein